MSSIKNNDQQLRVSIGLPVFNGAIHIRQTLDSLLEQTFREFELVISDNASTDETGSICQEYAKKDGRIRYIRQQENIGAIKNFSFVLQESVYKYFMWAAADDYYAPDHLQSLVAELDVHPEAIVSMSATKRVFPDGTIKDVIEYKHNGNPNNSGPVTMAWRIASGQLYHFYIYGLFRKSYIETAFNAMPSLKGADRIFIMATALSGNFRYVDKVSYTRRVYKGDAHVRYALSDPHLAKQYRETRSILFAIIGLFLYLVKSKNIPTHRKFFIPLIVFRYANFLFLNFVKIWIKN
ncbi:MAG: glycosyltransferase family 2 protein [Sideroxyarcus sp.]